MTKNNLKVVKSTKDQELENKEKNKALEAAISQITDNFGKGSVMKLGEKRAMDIESISTGSLSLDLALGIGGLPKGRIIEVYGPESSGKTTLALQVVAEGENSERAIFTSFSDGSYSSLAIVRSGLFPFEIWIAFWRDVGITNSIFTSSPKLSMSSSGPIIFS